MNKLLAIRCIGDQSRGYGHFSRCIAIANYFSTKNYKVVFLIDDDKFIKNELSKFKLNFYQLPKFKTLSSQGKFLKNYLVENNVSCFIIDMREFSEKLSKEIKECTCLSVVIDDSSIKNVYSNILLNGNPIIKYHKYRILNKKTQLLLGYDYFLTNLEFSKNKKKLYEIKPKKIYTVVVSCGGSDVNNLTWKIIKEILSISNIKIQAIIGPLSKQEDIIKTISKSIEIIHSPKNIWKFFNQSDLVICTSGSTLFELSLQGIPCINIATVKHQIPYGLNFSKSKFGIYMGYWNKFDFSKIKPITENLLSNTIKRKQMSVVGKQLIDGNGMKRFEKIISSMIN